MTTSAFRPLTQAETIFKQLVFEPAIKAGELWLEGDVPALDFPVLKQLDEAVIGGITDWVYNQFVLLIDVTAIKLVNAEHNAAYTSASIGLMVLAADQGIDSDAFKTARDAELLVMAKFTHMGP